MMICMRITNKIPKIFPLIVSVDKRWQRRMLRTPYLLLEGERHCHTKTDPNDCAADRFRCHYCTAPPSIGQPICAAGYHPPPWLGTLRISIWHGCTSVGIFELGQADCPFFLFISFSFMSRFWSSQCFKLNLLPNLGLQLRISSFIRFVRWHKIRPRSFVHDELKCL